MAEDKPLGPAPLIHADKGLRIVHRPAPELLRPAWEDLQAHNLVRVVFYDGVITTFEQFLALAYAEWGHFYGLTFEGRVEGIAWLNCFEGRVCRGHFSGIPSGLARAKLHGENFANWVLHANHPKEPGKYWLNAIIGATPGNNRLALRFIKQIGFRIMATVPDAVVPVGQDAPVDLVLSILNRKTLKGEGA